MTNRSITQTFQGFLIQYTSTIKATHNIKKVIIVAGTILERPNHRANTTWTSMEATKLPNIAANILLVLPNLVLNKYFLLAGIIRK